jgi:N-methylhydantoinase B/oxoprolinase/acetone carboxylase alpha subunit
MSKVDSITVEVIRNYLLSAAREMARNLMRTSYSTIVYEIRDFGLGIYDKHGRMVAEAPGLAIFTAPMISRCGRSWNSSVRITFTPAT